MSSPEGKGGPRKSIPPVWLNDPVQQSTPTRQALASDPQTPLPMLLELLEEFPEEVLANAAWMLQLMVEPEFLRKLPLEAAMALAAHPRTPPEMLDQLARMDPLRCEELRPAPREGVHGHEKWRASTWLSWVERLGANPSAPLPCLFRLLLSSRTGARLAVKRNPSAPAAWFELLTRAGSDPSLLRCRGAQGPITEDERQQLVEGGHWGRVVVAARGDTPEPIRKKLFKAMDRQSHAESAFLEAWNREGEELAFALLRSSALTLPEVCRACEYLMGEHEARQVKEGKRADSVEATRSSTLDPAWIARVMSAGDSWQRTLLASNVDAPFEVLLRLALGNHRESRVAALLNPSIERALEDDPWLLTGISDEEARELSERDVRTMSAIPPCLQEHIAWFSGRPSARR